MTGTSLLVGGSGPIGAAVRDLAAATDVRLLWTSRTDARAPIVLDVEDAGGVRRALRETSFETVLYLARHGENESESSRTLARFIDEAEQAGVRRIVYASSAAVYGTRSRSPHRESDRPDPATPYARAKAGAEVALRSATGIDTVALRIFNVYGPGLRDSLINRMFTRTAEIPAVFDSADFVRDYVHVTDVARAILLAATADLPGHSVLNVGSGIGTTNADLLAMPGARAKRIPLLTPSWSVAAVSAADQALGPWRTTRLAAAIEELLSQP